MFDNGSFLRRRKRFKTTKQQYAEAKMLKNGDSSTLNNCNLDGYENDEYDYDDEDDEYDDVNSHGNCDNENDNNGPTIMMTPINHVSQAMSIDDPRKPVESLPQTVNTKMTNESQTKHKSKPSFSIDNIIGNRKKPRNSTTLTNVQPCEPQQQQQKNHTSFMDETFKSNYFKQFFDQINYINQFSMNMSCNQQLNDVQKVNLSTSSIESSSSACISPSSSPSSLSASSSAFAHNRTLSDTKTKPIDFSAVQAGQQASTQSTTKHSPLVDTQLVVPSATAAAMAAAAAAACALYPQLGTNPLKQQQTVDTSANLYRLLNDTLLMRVAASHHQQQQVQTVPNQMVLFQNSSNMFQHQRDLTSLLPLYYPINT
jgi:hypothetical protein